MPRVARAASPPTALFAPPPRSQVTGSSNASVNISTVQRPSTGDLTTAGAAAAAGASLAMVGVGGDLRKRVTPCGAVRPQRCTRDPARSAPAPRQLPSARALPQTPCPPSASPPPPFRSPRFGAGSAGAGLQATVRKRRAGRGGEVRALTCDSAVSGVRLRRRECVGRQWRGEIRRRRERWTRRWSTTPCSPACTRPPLLPRHREPFLVRHKVGVGCSSSPHHNPPSHPPPCCCCSRNRRASPPGGW